MFFGTPKQLLRSKRSLTARYLRGEGKMTVESGSESIVLQPGGQTIGAAGRKSTLTPCLEVQGASQHNLKHIDVKLPLNRLVCVTGVSGSGKSTLIQDVMYNALRKLQGKPVETPGACRAIKGYQDIDEVVSVDQSPIGKTTRSNPASYVGAWNAIRELFAAEPQARERGYRASTFSFNSGNGRCPTCGGNGFEHVEMQFLSDVYLRCPDCNGTRYRPEVLEIRLDGKSVADVLDMTVNEALVFFAAQPAVQNALEPLAAVGLDYLRLGQPVPTLSGGEAQRLKLAGHLAKAGGKKKSRETEFNSAPSKSHTLFLFDEPTTGLHFDDIRKLLGAFRRLIGVGHSLVVIEHNLDVIGAADWVIDLGPEGGEAGGELVCEGTPQQVAEHRSSHTGTALREYRQQLAAIKEFGVKDSFSLKSSDDDKGSSRKTVSASKFPAAIQILHAREHNLKNVTVDIPRDKFTVITGVSGSGKSTVAFDILFNEGQRRYLESLNAYARQFVQPASRADVDAIFGIPPTVAIEQRTSRGGRKSTVATLTEVYHFLRLLFVKLGTQYCPDCDLAVQPQSAESILAQLLRTHRNRDIELLAPLVVARKGYYTDLAKWAAGKGFRQLRVDGELLPTHTWPRLDRYREHDIELPLGSIKVTAKNETALRSLLNRALAFGQGVITVVGARGETTFSTHRACPGCGRSFEQLDPRLFSYNSKHGWCEACYGTGLKLAGFDAEQSGEEIWWTDWWEGETPPCPRCDGRRLNPEALAVRFRNKSIADFTGLTVQAGGALFDSLELRGRDAEIARDILPELQTRLKFLADVGLSYLTLDRAAPTLSGGEAQRIRLAAQLGSNLRGVCYILDEPTIGLHPRDSDKLLRLLKDLARRGNTVLVVEHDRTLIRGADWVIDLGPEGGAAGGHLVASGKLAAIMASRDMERPLPNLALFCPIKCLTNLGISFFRYLNGGMLRRNMLSR